MTGQTPAPATSTLEWGGSDRRYVLANRRLRRPATWVLAVLAALALFGSLVEPWQVLDGEVVFGMGSQEGDLQLGAGRIAGWGLWWIFTGTVLATLVALTLLGQRALVARTRSIGLAASVAALVVLGAATINLVRESQLGFFPVDIEPDVGRGLYLAYAAVVLLAAALWLAPTGAGRAQRRSDRWSDDRAPAPDGPHDLSVGPAEPDTLQG